MYKRCKFLIRYVIVNVFSVFSCTVDRLFIFLRISFEVYKFLILMFKLSFFFFLFLSLVLFVLSEKPLPKQWS